MAEGKKKAGRREKSVGVRESVQGQPANTEAMGEKEEGVETNYRRA